MSIKSWLREHYPTDAKKAVRSDLMAAKHSLRKWQGYTKEALSKHGLEMPPNITLGSDGCALCQKHALTRGTCRACPIASQTSDCDLHDGSPFAIYVFKNDPLPMIKVLKECVDRLKEC